MIDGTVHSECSMADALKLAPSLSRLAALFGRSPVLHRHFAKGGLDVLLTGCHFSQLDGVIDGQRGPRGQMRLGAHVIQNRVERDAKVACGARRNSGLRLDAWILVVAEANRARS